MRISPTLDLLTMLETSITLTIETMLNNLPLGWAVRSYDTPTGREYPRAVTLEGPHSTDQGYYPRIRCKTSMEIYATVSLLQQLDARGETFGDIRVWSPGAPVLRHVIVARGGGYVYEVLPDSYDGHDESAESFIQYVTAWINQQREKGRA